MKWRDLLACTASAAGLLAVSGGAAWAAPAANASAAASTGSALEEVVVTARKMGAEKVQDVPAAITALGAQQLETMRVQNFADFAYAVPGLTFNSTGPGEKRYILRGIQSAGQEQVAVYYDEVPSPGIQSSSGDSGSQTADLLLYDLEHIEVLRGPQGTTFGANSQTGVVRYITAKPNLSRIEGSVQASAQAMSEGSPGSSVYGMFNMPLVNDKVALRFVGMADYAGGYVDNVRLNMKDINWARTYAGRLSLRAEPTSTTTVDAMVWLQNRDTGGASGYMPYDTFHERGDPTDQGFKDTVPQFAYFRTGEFNNGDYVRTPRPDNLQIYSLTLNQDFGWSNLTAAGSIYKRKLGFLRDNTWSVISLGVGPAGATCLKNKPCVRPDLFPELTDQTQDIDQKTVELRLNSTTQGPLRYLVGVFYRDRTSAFQSVSPIVNGEGVPFPITAPPPGYSTAPGAGVAGCVPCALARYNTRAIKETAFFGELTYAPIEQVELMAGLRQYEADQRDDGVYAFQFPLLGNSLPAPDHRHFKESKLIKKFQATYRPNSDVTLYALASQGFRLGGTNQAATIGIPSGYNSDSLWNYEGGLKSVWFDHRLTVNAAAFYIDWQNIQVSGRDPSGAFAFIGNAGAAKVVGFELEVFAHPIQGLDLSAGLGWLPKRELTEDQVNSTVVAPGKAGDKIPRIPEITADLGAQYTFDLPVDNWTSYARLDWFYHGRSGTELRPNSATYRTQHAYDITNVKLGFDNANKDLNLTLFLNNVFDVHGDVYVIGATATPTTKYTNTPRVIGASISKKF
jgi:outer membrane receptor protein involved in Fe transport